MPVIFKTPTVICGKWCGTRLGKSPIRIEALVGEPGGGFLDIRTDIMVYQTSARVISGKTVPAIDRGLIPLPACMIKVGPRRSHKGAANDESCRLPWTQSAPHDRKRR